MSKNNKIVNLVEKLPTREELRIIERDKVIARVKAIPLIELLIAFFNDPDYNFDIIPDYFNNIGDARRYTSLRKVHAIMNSSDQLIIRSITAPDFNLMLFPSRADSVYKVYHELVTLVNDLIPDSTELLELMEKAFFQSGTPIDQTIGDKALRFREPVELEIVISVLLGRDPI